MGHIGQFRVIKPLYIGDEYIYIYIIATFQTFTQGKSKPCLKGVTELKQCLEDGSKHIFYTLNILTDQRTERKYNLLYGWCMRRLLRAATRHNTNCRSSK